MYFGMPIPEDVTPVVRWGARAIYNGGNQYTKYKDSFSLLPDRQGVIRGEGCTDSNAEHLITWVNQTGLPMLRKWMNKSCTGSSSRQLFRLKDGLYYMLASPNASYGYLYIVALLINPEKQEQIKTIEKYIDDWDKATKKG